ncbi:MAG TPA: sulfite exporter TauE/SafE family protein [Acidimicrobiales bacterium]|nr:sulfite exporter TauE/SafE family protein [Acidimicrobiales bacterium]
MDGHLALAAFAVAAGAVAQAVTGFGFSLVSAPFLVAAAAAPRGVEWNLVLSTGLNLVLLGRGWRLVHWSDVGRLLVPAVAATVVVGYLVRHADRSALTIAAGSLCLLATVVVATGWRRHRTPGPVGAVAAGGISGAMNVVAGIGGPPVVVYGLTAGWPTGVARPTLQAFFLVINAVAIPSLGVTSVPVALPVALLAGVVVGLAVARRLPEPWVRSAILVVAAAGSALAILRGAGVL